MRRVQGNGPDLHDAMTQDPTHDDAADGSHDDRLQAFAAVFGSSASSLIPSSGWVFYVVGTGLKVKHFLRGTTDPGEMDAYLKNFAALDPLSPLQCVEDDRFVACLHEELSPRLAQHRRYRREFMEPFGIVDTLDVVLQAGTTVVGGLSMVRHGQEPLFCGREIAHADALRRLGNFMLSQLSAGQLASVDAITRRFPTLTPKEVALLRLVILGLSNKQLCLELGIALPTVKTHLLNIFRKLGTRTRAELAAKLLL